jgi:hypothetical protein
MRHRSIKTPTIPSSSVRLNPVISQNVEAHEADVRLYSTPSHSWRLPIAQPERPLKDSKGSEKCLRVRFLMDGVSCGNRFDH